MKTVALISGGKDSCFNLMCCIAEGHDVIALANLRPVKKDELDSYMFQTVGHHAIDLYAEALDLPLYTQTIHGSSLSTGRDYQPQEGDEVEDLHSLLSHVKAELDIEAVSVGAILSDYQRVRVENVCQRLNLVVLSYLWRRNQADLLKEMIDCDLKAILIKVAALGLDPNRHLGLQLPEIYPHMMKMRSQYGLNECGEGGEYETFVFDCPVFKKAIVIDEVEKVLHSDDAFAPVGYLNLKRCHLQEKKWDSSVPLREQVLKLPIRTSRKCYPPSHGSIQPSDPPQYVVPAQNDEIQPKFCTNGKDFQVSGIQPLAGTGDDISSVAERAMKQLTECVERMGHSREDMVSVSLFVENMANFGSINAVYKTFFDINPPIRVCVQACLPPNVPLQLDCQGRRCEAASDRRTMHVQALSHWAPANIGPYSQAVWVNDTVYLAGIVPLVPATLNLVEGDARTQCHTALSHVAKVLSAICPGADLSHCPLVVCYLTSPDYVPTARAVLRDARSDLPVTRLPLTVQFCVVPSLPKAAVVEWKVFAWPSLEAEEDSEVTCSKQSSEDYTLSLFLVRHKQKPEQFSCNITLDLTTQREEALSPADVVENLMKLYTQALLQPPAQQMPRLATVFYVYSAFQYSELRQCLDQAMDSLGDGQFCISLVPVLDLDSPQQLLAWCQ